MRDLNWCTPDLQGKGEGTERLYHTPAFLGPVASDPLAGPLNSGGGAGGVGVHLRCEGPPPHYPVVGHPTISFEGFKETHISIRCSLSINRGVRASTNFAYHPATVRLGRMFPDLFLSYTRLKAFKRRDANALEPDRQEQPPSKS